MPKRYINCTRENCSDINIIIDPEIEIGYIDICPTCGATSIVSLNEPLYTNYESPNKHTENTLIMLEEQVVEVLSLYTKENNREKNYEKNKRNSSDKLGPNEGDPE